MGVGTRNRYWDRGFTSRGLAGSAVANGVIALGAVSLWLVDSEGRPWGWLLAVGCAVVAAHFGWQAVRLRAFERAQRIPESEAGAAARSECDTHGG
ncbi:hypothetical protein [Herbiconiux sp. A18JL235]|uniref:Uncharacterized protein n=1 Tax=Herbiconiux sp. A18JL235 TaxID=3152363 RepID=A0AB39BJ42_9MICO